MSWLVYIVLCKDDTLYTGITNDIENRLKKHNNGTGAKYTRGRGPVKLVYSSEMDDKSSALKEEYRIKKLSRMAKYLLVGEIN